MKRYDLVIALLLSALVRAELGSYNIVEGDAEIAEVPVVEEYRLQSFAQAKQKEAQESPQAALNVLLAKRQTCSPGYGYCNYAISCCPLSNKCCPYGYCLEPDHACCPTGPCRPGETCCGLSHCMPEGSRCCSNERFCERGNVCVEIIASGRIVCCTDLLCTAHVENGITTYGSTTTSTNVVTTTASARYYYATYTWYYYSYYWSYSVVISASVVTSTRVTTTTVYSVRTTDAGAASEYFDGVSETMEFETPGEATTLADLAGQTSSAAAPGFDNDGDDDGTSSSGTFTGFPGFTVTGGSGGGGGGGSGASGTESLGTGWMGLVVAMAVGTGILAVVL